MDFLSFLARCVVIRSFFKYFFFQDTLSSDEGTLGGTIGSWSTSSSSRSSGSTSSRSLDTTQDLLSDTSPDVSRLSIEDPRDPDEPITFAGQTGKPLNVTANYLRLVTEPGSGVFEYEIKYQPAVDQRIERFRLIRQCEEVIGTVKVKNFFL